MLPICPYLEAVVIHKLSLPYICTYIEYVHIEKSTSIYVQLLYMHVCMEACTFISICIYRGPQMEYGFNICAFFVYVHRYASTYLDIEFSI